MSGNILVPLDGSNLAETVLPYVKQIAGALQWEVQLLRVVQVQEYKASGKAKGAKPSAAEDASKAADQYLKKIVQYFKGSGRTVAASVTAGFPASVVIEEADRQPGALVAMSTHGRSGITRWVIGSVADKVLRYSNNPLLLVKPSPRSPIAGEPELHTVIVPLDGSKTAEEVLPHVVGMARAMPLKVILVRVTPTIADYYKWTDAGFSYTPDFSETAAQADREAAAYLKRVSTRLKNEGVAEVETQLLHSDPAAAINDLAASVEDVFVAMTTQGRTGLARTVLGSVADRVVQNCGAPVFLVRPA